MKRSIHVRLWAISFEAKDWPMPLRIQDCRLPVRSVPEEKEFRVWLGSLEEQSRRRQREKQSKGDSNRKRKPNSSKRLNARSQRPRRSGRERPNHSDALVDEAVDLLDPQTDMEFDSDNTSDCDSLGNPDSISVSGGDDLSDDQKDDKNLVSDSESCGNEQPPTEQVSQEKTANSSSSDSSTTSSTSSSSDSSSSSEDGSDGGAGNMAMVPRAKPIQKHDRKPGGSRDTQNHEVFDLGNLGEIRYYPAHKIMIAFCGQRSSEHAPDCRMQRTTAPKGDLPSGGRPIGHLIAWLQQGSNFDCACSHKHAALISLEQRKSARAYFQTLPNWERFAAFERPQRPSEPSEPARSK